MHLKKLLFKKCREVSWHNEREAVRSPWIRHWSTNKHQTLYRTERYLDAQYWALYRYGCNMGLLWTVSRRPRLKKKKNRLSNLTWPSPDRMSADAYRPFRREPKRSSGKTRAAHVVDFPWEDFPFVVSRWCTFYPYSLAGVVDDLWYRLQINYERNRREEIVRTRLRNNIPYAFARSRAISQSNSKSVDAFRRKR